MIPREHDPVRAILTGDVQMPMRKPHACPRCESTNVQPTLLTSYQSHWECRACHYGWNEPVRREAAATPISNDGPMNERFPARD